jgi:hypothetical protein
MEETKIIYYRNEDKMPYLIKLNLAPDKATLRDFKNALNVNVKCFKYYFQTIMEDFGYFWLYYFKITFKIYIIN